MKTNEVSQQRGSRKLLRLGLVSIPVKLVNAVKVQESFRLISPCHSARLEQIRKCSTCAAVVSYEETVRAVGLTKDVNIALNADEYSSVRGVRESTDVEVLKVVDSVPVPSDKSYWVVPENCFSVYATLVKVLFEQNKRLFASVVLRKNGKNNLLSVGSDGLRLKADVLVTAERVVAPPTLAPNVIVKEVDASILSKYLDTLKGVVSIEDVTDQSAARLLEICEAKLKGEVPAITTTAVVEKKELDTFALLAQAMGA